MPDVAPAQRSGDYALRALRRAAQLHSARRAGLPAPDAALPGAAPAGCSRSGAAAAAGASQRQCPQPDAASTQGSQVPPDSTVPGLSASLLQQHGVFKVGGDFPPTLSTQAGEGYKQGGGLEPPTLDGPEEHWQERSFVMRDFLGGQTQVTQRLLGATGGLGSEPDTSAERILNSSDDEGTAASHEMFLRLVMTMKGVAQMIARGASQAAVWVQSIMARILEVKQFPHARAEFEEARAEWGRDITWCEMAAGEDFNVGVVWIIYLYKAP
ncbi:unnamed protein product [Prorocentrum cordatum]|uniref:Uncharacterized protein n=1 Tax=Prorocentrum cordatum TaxID=2364126 RepID=A0ABN9WDM4_9DINO|nr:unnamed protein product [Polarella glacialis]